MKRLLPRLLCTIVALSFVVEAADAQVYVRRKPSFFERLFGVQPRRVVKRPRNSVVIYNDNYSDDFFSDELPPRRRVKQKGKKRYLFGNDDGTDVTILAPSRAKKKVVSKSKSQPKLPAVALSRRVPEEPAKKSGSEPLIDEPEPLAGFGMGNLPYFAPKPLKLYNENAMSFLADGPEEEALRSVFFDESSPLVADDKDRLAVFEFYSSNGYKPVWTKNGLVATRASTLVSHLAKANDEGLNAAHYLPQGLESFTTDLSTWRLDAKQQAQFDIALTVAALRYARHVSGGQFLPGKLSLYHDIKPPTVDMKTALRVLAYSPYPEQYLASLAPQNAEYKLLKAELKALGASVGGGARIPSEGAVVKKGQRDVRMPQLRSFLLAESFIDPADALVSEDDRDMLDKELSAALKAFQQANGISASGQLDKATLGAVNKDKTAEHRNALMVNLERMRWLPRDLGANHIFVNQAAYELTVVKQKQPVFITRVVVGAPLTQTYSFHDKLENIVFNPTWTMPQSILVNEYLKKLRARPGYFDKIGYDVFDKDGEKVKSSSVRWSTFEKGIPYTVVQPSGGANALGEVKFNFPNKHAIYLHDTPAKKLFANNMRAYSHGCIRVEDPKDLAKVLLGWDDDQIKSATKGDELRATPVLEDIQVHLTYFTAWPDATGNIRYFKDVYERDQTMVDAIGTIKVQVEKPKTFKILASLGESVKTDYLLVDASGEPAETATIVPAPVIPAIAVPVADASNPAPQVVIQRLSAN